MQHYMGLWCCFSIIHKTTVVESLPTEGPGFGPQHFPEEKRGREGKCGMWLCQALL